MIDIEAEIFTKVRNAVKAEFPNAEISGKTLIKPTQFPAISFIEENNDVVLKMRDNENVENGADLMYELQVFSVANNSKTEVKAIVAIVDSIMYDYNFTKTFGGKLSNMYDVGVYRYAARYAAIIDKDKNIYRR